MSTIVRRTSAAASRGACGLVIGAIVVFAVGSADRASADNPLPLSQARARADAARGDRQAAEARLAGLMVQRDQLNARLGSLSGEAQRLARDLERAAKLVREHAVASFIDGDSADGLADLMSASDMIDASARRTLLSTRTVETIEAAAELQRLKEQNDPALVALGEQLDALDSQVAQAESDVVQTRGYEADAERELSRAEDSARRAAAAAAAAANRANRPVVAPLPQTAGDDASGGSGGGSDPAAVVADPSPDDADLPDPPPGGPSEEQWAALRNCESGGNYSAVSRSGLYRGAYQFSVGTWRGVGGDGDPAAASPAEQDLRAKILYSRRGSNPWPVCGRFLR